MEQPLFCPMCNGPLKPGVKFCTSCGYRLDGQPRPQPPAQQASQQPAAKGGKKQPQAQAKKGFLALPSWAILLFSKQKSTTTVKTYREWYVKDRSVPEGQPAPHAARAGAFIFDLFVMNMYVQACFWFIIFLPVLSEVRAYSFTAGEMPVPLPIGKIITFIVACVIFVVFYGLIPIAASGRTLGKWLAGIAVCTRTGDPITLERSIRRCFGYIVSALPLGIGFFYAYFNDWRETFHDRLAGTRTVHTRKSGTIKMAVIVASVPLLFICTGISVHYMKFVIGHTEFKSAVPLSTPEATADALCKAQANPFFLFYMLPVEERTGMEGLKSFYAYHKMMSKQLPDINAISVAKSRTECSVEGVKKRGDSRAKVSLLVRTRQAVEVQPPPQRVVYMLSKIGEEWLPYQGEAPTGESPVEAKTDTSPAVPKPPQ